MLLLLCGLRLLNNQAPRAHELVLHNVLYPVVHKRTPWIVDPVATPDSPNVKFVRFSCDSLGSINFVNSFQITVTIDHNLYFHCLV